MWLFTRCVMSNIVMLENIKSVNLHEMIKNLLCMNPVNAEQMVAG